MLCMATVRLCSLCLVRSCLRRYNKLPTLGASSMQAGYTQLRLMQGKRWHAQDVSALKQVMGRRLT